MRTRFCLHFSQLGSTAHHHLESRWKRHVAVTFTKASGWALGEHGPHHVGTSKQEQMFSEETNLPLFFYVFILFIPHANVSIRQKKVKKDVENIGYGGRTVTNAGSPIDGHLFCRQFFAHHLMFTIGDKMGGRNTNKRSQFRLLLHQYHSSRRGVKQASLRVVGLKCC